MSAYTHRTQAGNHTNCIPFPSSMAPPAWPVRTFTQITGPLSLDVGKPRYVTQNRRTCMMHVMYKCTRGSGDSSVQTHGSRESFFFMVKPQKNAKFEILLFCGWCHQISAACFCFGVGCRQHMSHGWRTLSRKNPPHDFFLSVGPNNNKQVATFQVNACPCL